MRGRRRLAGGRARSSLGPWVDIIGASDALFAFDTDTYLSVDGSGNASAWGDQSPLANSLSQSSAAARVSVAAGIDGHLVLRNSDYSAKTLDRTGTFSGVAQGDHPVVYLVTAFTGQDNESAFLFNWETSAPGDGFALYHAGGANLFLAGRAYLKDAASFQVTTYAAHNPPYAAKLYKLAVTEEGANSSVQVSINGALVAAGGPTLDGDGLHFVPDTLNLFGARGEYSRNDVYCCIGVKRNLSAVKERLLMARLASHYPSLGL